ncbi:MAG: hypothetical protein FJ006_12245 [Chloroflexi bacterium]|nr:hypothetical protein [Chloroflexota bacterium]
MTLKQYALGVFVSTTCIISGLLWYDRQYIQDVRAEDIAACIAAGVERKWVTDWATPETNIVTAYAKASDLEIAASDMRAAIMSADVIYLDGDTWADGGLDMAYSLVYTNQSWRLVTNTVINPVSGPKYWMDVRANTPEKIRINGIALADKYMPVYVITSNISITTNQVYAEHTNLYIVSQDGTTGPNWADEGRPNGTILYWNTSLGFGENYTNVTGEANWWYPVYFYGKWQTWHLWDHWWGWSTTSSTPAGVYTPMHHDEGQTGSVVIAWHDSVTVVPLITTTNMTLTYHGGTNMPLYNKLGNPPDYDFWGSLIGGTNNSWWAYAGYGDQPYWLLDVEKPGGTLATPVGTGKRYIETKNLNQIRNLGMDMFRTVQFDFPVTGTNTVFSGLTTNPAYFLWGSDVAIGYASIPAQLVGTTNHVEINTVVGVMAKEASRVATFEDSYMTIEPSGWETNPDISRVFVSITTNVSSTTTNEFSTTTNYIWIVDYTRAYCGEYQNSRKQFSPTIPLAAYTNGYIGRMRIYVATESRSPYTYPARTNYVLSSYQRTYEQLYYGENQAQTYGWDVTHGGVPEDALPRSEVFPWADFSGGYGGNITVAYLTTNFVWSLVYDEVAPTNIPTIVIGPEAFIDESYFATTPPLDYTAVYFYPEPIPDKEIRIYYRACETRILHSALVIDWDFKLFGDTPYAPIETNKPAYLPELD